MEKRACSVAKNADDRKAMVPRWSTSAYPHAAWSMKESTVFWLGMVENFQAFCQPCVRALSLHHEALAASDGFDDRHGDESTISPCCFWRMRLSSIGGIVVFRLSTYLHSPFKVLCQRIIASSSFPARFIFIWAFSWRRRCCFLPSPAACRRSASTKPAGAAAIRPRHGLLPRHCCTRSKPSWHRCVDRTSQKMPCKKMSSTQARHRLWQERQWAHRQTRGHRRKISCR